ncbi:hypothetical protein [Parabacteroides gordonii]|uniref:hypothetical protein n=1 Tax=Parabacteroides gordonii TaxID=574930 RepID=UPI0026EED2C2|nr:hypothetical protein [Parabacteroides gordonii]
MYKETFTEKGKTCIIYYGQQADKTEEASKNDIKFKKYEDNPCYYIYLDEKTDFVQKHDLSYEIADIGQWLYIKSILYLKEENTFSEFSSSVEIPLYNLPIELYKIIFFKHLKTQIRILNKVFNQHIRFEDYIDSVNNFVEHYYYHE